jgi:hypothetical protein
MWSKSAFLLMIQIKTQRGWGFTFPITLWVIDDWFEALTDLARVGEAALKLVPNPREPAARTHLQWVKRLSPSRILSISHILHGNYSVGIIVI